MTTHPQPSTGRRASRANPDAERVSQIQRLVDEGRILPDVAGAFVRDGTTYEHVLLVAQPPKTFGQDGDPASA